MKKLTILSALLILLSGCVAKTSIRWDLAAENKNSAVLDVPFFAQTEYNCGPAALAMLLKNSGVDVVPDNLVSQVYTPSKKGSLQPDMLQGARRNGRIPYVINTPEELFMMLGQGRAVSVFMNLGLNWHPVWHYAVVTGYNPADRAVYLHSGDTKNMKMGAATFDHVWKRGGYWGFILLKGGDVPEHADRLRLLDSVAAYEAAGFAKEALLTYTEAYKRWGGDRTVMFAYGNSLYANGQKIESAEIFTKITQMYQNDGDSYNNLANIQYELGDKVNARISAENAVKSGGKNLESYLDTLKTVTNP